jgi:hypothetical protein
MDNEVLGVFLALFKGLHERTPRPCSLSELGRKGEHFNAIDDPKCRSNKVGVNSGS